MYVVRRSFRNLGQMIVPGSVVEPGTVKHFKSHLRDRDIVEVSEQDFDKWNAYFLGKFGVPIAIVNNDANEIEETEEAEEAEEAEPVKVAVAKVIVK